MAMTRKPPSIRWQRFESSDIFVDEAVAVDLNARFYRYSSFPELVDLISNHTISFSHPSKWPDRYEHHALETGFGEKGPFRKKTPFAKCFSSAFSSDALWRLYRVSGPVFRYGFSLRSMLNWLSVSDISASGKVYVGMVNYLPSPKVRSTRTRLDQEPVSQAAAQWLLTKRDGFDYEKELRVVVIQKSRASATDVISVSSSEPLKLRKILVDPYLPAWEFELYKKIISSLSPACRIEQSMFDKVP